MQTCLTEKFKACMQGVNTTTISTTLGAVIQFNNINNVVRPLMPHTYSRQALHSFRGNRHATQMSRAQAIVNSRLINTGSGALSIDSSNIQILGGIFTNNFGTSAGAISITGSSSVLIDSTEVSNNTATAGGAVVV